MLTFGELLEDPSRIRELEGCDVLISASGTKEVVVQEQKQVPDATMVFMHETIAMMRAERTVKIEKIKSLLTPDAAVIALRKKPASFWDHITLGRASTADIVLDDLAVSNVHAHFALDVDDHPVSVQDEGSSNGTHLNRVQLQPHELAKLHSGDLVRFGQSIFYYLAAGMFKDLIGA